MRNILNINPVGRINRVGLPNRISNDEVLKRENFYVVGTGDEKRNRKIPGSSRHTTAASGTSYTSIYRYYTRKESRKTFAFNNGRIYHISDNGSSTVLDPIFSPVAIPSLELIRVSNADVLYFSEGIDTGLYSHDGNIGNSWNKETNVSLNMVGMLSHLDRLWGFEEDSEDLNFSKNLDPTNFTDSTDAGTITIGPRRGSKIMQIVILYGTIYIFKQDSIWRLTGRSPSEFIVEEVNPFLGCAARGSVRNTDNGVIFLGSDYEFYFFGGTIASTIMLTSKLAFGGDLTKNLLPLLNREKLSNIVSIFHNKIYRCSYVENGGTTNNMEYCFNTLNETDFLTRGFNISSYCKWDKIPDKNELLTGRTDMGHIMRHYEGLNIDNGATNPSMKFSLQTKYLGSEEPRNIRFKRIFFNMGVLGAEPLTARYYLDCRNSVSDAGIDEWPIRGEYKTVAGFKISSQDAITSRVNLDYGKSKGQNISVEINHEGKDIDVEVQNIQIEVVAKPTRKFSEKVAA